MIHEALVRLLERESLTQAEAQAVMEQIMDGQATPAQIGAFLAALRLKGETEDEVAGFAVAMVGPFSILYRSPGLRPRLNQGWRGEDTKTRTRA